MMVDNIGGVNPAAANIPAQKAKSVYQFKKPDKLEDTVQLSSDVMKVRGVNEVRVDKIMEIRQQIADGTYITPEKLDIALDRAIDDAMGQS